MLLTGPWLGAAMLYGASALITLGWLYLLARESVEEEPIQDPDDAFVLAGFLVFLAAVWPLTCLAIIIAGEIVRARGGFREDDE